MLPSSSSVMQYSKSQLQQQLQGLLDQGHSPEALQKAGWGNYLFQGLNYNGAQLANQSYVGMPAPGASTGGATTGGTAAGGTTGSASPSVYQGGAAASGGTGSTTIGGSLPFSGAGGGMIGAAGNVNALGQSYNSAYNAALAMNSQNYSNILNGYQQTAANQSNVQKGIQGGYNQLGTDVQNTIQGVDASQRQAISDQYAQAQGQATQDLTNRGLGNTTVTNSVNRGLGLDQAKANIALSNQMAQLQAGYKSQLGLAGLGFANQANMQNTGWSGKQLDWMNSVNANYPNADAYARLAMQAGAVGQGLGGGGTSRNIDMRYGSGGGGGLVGPATTGQNSPFTAPNLSPGAGMGSMGGGMGGGSGGGGSSYYYNGIPQTQQQYQADLSGGGISGNYGYGGYAEPASSGMYAGSGAFTGGGGSAIGALGGGILDAGNYFSGTQPGQDLSYNFGGGPTSIGSFSDRANALLNGNYNASYGNVFDSGTGAYSNAALPDMSNGYVTTIPWNDTGLPEQSYNSSGFGGVSWPGGDPTQYDYPVGSAGGYGW